jgi:uncharacterized protein with ATP-grasp and redox domains
MKAGERCGFCLLYRGYKEIARSTEDEKVRFEAVSQLLKLLANDFTKDTVPSILGAKRDRLIRRITGCLDPYAEVKKAANAKALKMLPLLASYVEEKQAVDRLRSACKISCIGNVIEYDVPGHSPALSEILSRVEDEELYIDQIEVFRNHLRPNINVLYLSDNAGEIVLDRLLVRELQSLGCHVKVAVKGGPALNDALLSDAEEAGMVDEADEVITTGIDALGVNLSESSKVFVSAYWSAEVIVAKGMANWETLTEYPAPCPTLFLFRVKCEPVARAVNAPIQSNIAKFIPEGWKL